MVFSERIFFIFYFRT